MKIARKLLAPATVLFAVLLVAGFGQAQQRDNVRPFMRAKLVHSQKVLEGLTIENFELIAKSAGQLEVLSQDVAWQVLQTAEYRQQSLEFRRATQSLKLAADEESIDGAALAYVDVTMKCVKCHQYVRSVRNASFAEGYYTNR